MKKLLFVLSVVILLASCGHKSKKSCEATCKDSLKTECTAKADSTKVDSTAVVK